MADEKQLPVAVAGLAADLSPAKFKDKELDLIRSLAEGADTPSNWRSSVLYKVMYVLPVPIAIVDLNGYIVSANEEMQEFMGYSEVELQHMRFDNFVRPQDRLPDRTNFNKLIAGDLDHYRMDKSWIGKSGEEHKGKLVVVRIPWPKELVKAGAAAMVGKRHTAPTGDFPAAIAMVLTNDRGAVIENSDPNFGNRTLFGVLPEWAIDKISRMTWSQSLSLVLVLGSLVTILGLLLHFIPNLIQSLLAR